MSIVVILSRLLAGEGAAGVVLLEVVAAPPVRYRARRRVIPSKLLAGKASPARFLRGGSGWGGVGGIAWTMWCSVGKEMYSICV